VGAELRLELLCKRFRRRERFRDGKRRRTAAGHERNQRAIFAKKFLIKFQHGKFVKRRRFE
jgi:hypothetical protein